MNFLQNFWFLISFLLIGIILLIDPKNSFRDLLTAIFLGFSSPNQGQEFIYQVASFTYIPIFYSKYPIKRYLI